MTTQLNFEDDHISISSTQSEGFLCAIEDRAPSSLSMASRLSKIPQLQKPSRQERRSVCSMPRSPVKPEGLCRSASFSSSRGLTTLGSNIGYGHAVPSVKPKAFYTPELSRKMRSYVSPYSKKVIMADKPVKTNNTRLSKNDDDDKESVKSFASNSSTTSCDHHAHIYGSNGRPKNVFHCRHSSTDDPDAYLTPTQRAMRKIKELQVKLKQAQKELAEKDCKIASLTRELVDYRFLRTEVDVDFPDSGTHDLKNSHRKSVNPENEAQKRPKSASPCLGSPALLPSASPPSDTSEPELRDLSRLTINEGSGVKENFHRPSSGESDSAEFNRSLADSGHYDDLPSPCLSSKDSFPSTRHANRRSMPHLTSDSVNWAMGAAEETIRTEYENKIEELKRNQMNEYHELKEKHNDHVELLLAKLSEANLRYFELRPQLDKTTEKMKELEEERDRLKEDLIETAAKQQKIYLQMYIKGQQAAKLEAEQKKTQLQSLPSTLTDLGNIDASLDGATMDLAKHLAEAEAEILRLKLNGCDSQRSQMSTLGKPEDIDPQITLQFLKSAIYYFLTDKDNSQGHLRAIESILGYSSTERNNISKGSRI